mgnify:CR=1 FL=1
MEATDERTLRLEIPSAGATKLAADPTWTAISPATGWVQSSSFPLTLSWTGTIDLSGYTREMKTFYPSAAFTQRGPSTLSQGGAGIQTYTIISSIPLVPEVVLNQLISGGPGFLTFGPGNQNWDTVIFAESQTYVVNANITPNPFGILQLLDSHQSSSLSPTASDTLYCLKIVSPNDAAQTTLLLPASRILLPGKFASEPDVEYMMRLKRSVELSQQV